MVNANLRKRPSIYINSQKQGFENCVPCTDNFFLHFLHRRSTIVNSKTPPKSKIGNKIMCFAKASCAAAIRTARDIVADLGPLASLSGGVVELSKRSEKNSERDCHRIMTNRFGLSMPLQIDYLKTDGGPKIPFLRFRNWMRMMLDHNCFHIFCGLLKPDRTREECIWRAFWNNYEKQFPSHPLFQRIRSGEIDPARTIAVLAHGDEGRSKRRSAFLVLNLHSPLGRGTEPGLNSGRKRKYIKMLPNFVGHSYTNRFLVSALPKADYTGENSFICDLLLETLAEELAVVQSEGVVDRFGTKYWAVFIGWTGDWPWLVKSGGLLRSFSNIPKHATGPNAGPRYGNGICHLCDAGQVGVPYEDIGTRSPIWQGSVLQTLPWEGPNAWEAVPHVPGALATMWHFDLFHCFHLGLAKHYLGSMMAILSTTEPAGNIDERFGLMTGKYLSWCRSNKRQAHCQKLSKEQINWTSTTHFPSGAWRKGDLSTSLMLWVAARYASEDWTQLDPMLTIAGDAAQAVNKMLSILYRAEAWLSEDEALQAGEYGLRFLRRYSKLAQMSLQQRRPLWIILPKAHAFHHLVLSMIEGSRRGKCLNIICTSVQQDEDYIGRNSRLSRHVSSVTCAERVVERHLQSVYTKYLENKYLIRSGGG